MNPTEISIKSLRKVLPQIILLLTLMGIYLRTLAPGLTWANGGTDGGDLIAAAATGGIAHPTGYPLYLLLARLFQFLPIGNLAYRTNLMSALLTSLTAMMVFFVVTRFVSMRTSSPKWLVGLAAAYAFGLAPLTWSQAVITEVYALQAFLITVIIYLYMEPASHSKLNQLAGWGGLVLGFAVSNHVTAILLLPVVLIFGCVPVHLNGYKNPPPMHKALADINFKALGQQLFWFGIGLSPYLLLPVHALANPPINWGNPVTLERFWWLVTGELYQSYYFQFSLPEALQRIQAGAAMLIQQFGLLGVVVGIVGVLVYGSRTRMFIFTVWAAGVYAVFAFLYGSVDSYVYLIPTFLCFAIWIGLGISGLTNQFMRHNPALQVGFGLLMVGYFVLRALTFMSEVDASHDLRAESFGREVLTAAPKNAILFAKGDESVFTLWYYHLALGERPDVAIVAVDLLHFDWYQENLHSVYPSLQMPGPFPWPETIANVNSSRAACYVQYSDHAEMDCSPSLLTP